VGVYVGKKKITELGEGHLFGEMAILDAEPRSASIVAKEDTDLFGLSQKELMKAMDQEVQISVGIIRALSKRLRTEMQSEDWVSRSDFPPPLTIRPSK